jgi:tetratricopeptide (TPR) repeat protein
MAEGSDEGTLAQLCDRAEALRRMGRLDDAVAQFATLDLTQGATEADRLRVSLAQGRLFTDRIFYANRGYDEAVATLEAATALAKRFDNVLSSTTALDLLGLADYYRVMQTGSANYSAALGRFQEALAQREELHDSRGVAETLFHVGLVHERLEHYDDALDKYRRAYTLAKNNGYQLELSYAARHLAGGAQAMGDLNAAVALFRESLTLRQRLAYTLLLPLSHVALGGALLAQKDTDGAAHEYEQAHALAEGMQSPLAVVFSLIALSELAQARGNDDERREYVERALSRAQEDKLPLGVRVADAALTAIAQERP